MTADTSVSPTFSDLNLSKPVLKALEDVGYETPSPIQARMIPHVLASQDVLGQAQTGTGKTAAFALPLLSRLDMTRRDPQVLVLTPTRELAIQVAEAFQPLAEKAGGAAGSALVLGIGPAGCADDSAPDEAPAGPFVPNVFVAVNIDGTVQITVSRSEMGQGVRTSLPRIVADELEADLATLAALHRRRWDGSTGAFRSDAYRRRHAQERALVYVEHPPRLYDEERPQPLALGEGRIAHGFGHAGGTGAVELQDLPAGVEVLESLDALDRELRRLVD